MHTAANVMGIDITCDNPTSDIQITTAQIDNHYHLAMKTHEVCSNAHAESPGVASKVQTNNKIKLRLP